MSEVKQVKVDNWGIYFLQRLKHFFNRTDYCDLTLQFQDNAQLKVHRLVLSACTEYFELLERTCEMYEDCLVMPDDLQADVVVPIVNFMYTGHLEFRWDLLERLYQTSQILNMPVLTKLLESHRTSLPALTKMPTNNYSAVKRFTKPTEPKKDIKSTSNKRSYSKAFENSNIVYREKKVYHPLKISDAVKSPTLDYRPPSPVTDSITSNVNRRVVSGDPRPTRYELPEELDSDNVFDNSFCNISYACQPLMIHPETVKRYSSKRGAGGIFSEASSSKKLLPGTSTVDIVECKRVTKEDNIFDDSIPDHSMCNDELDIFQTYNNEPPKDSSQLFDQIIDEGPKVTIETKDSKVASNLDHAKIISEVLKKYPHLVKSNKNIKLKILNTPGKGKKQKISPTYIEDNIHEKVKPKLKTEEPDYTYETDVIDSQQAAKLIAMGAENTRGPWICLICGTPGKALHFTSYYKFRRHLVEVHNEKPVSNICEYCGLRSLKRNYLLHHLYAQHGVDPPPQYNFPKCNRCSYIALTEGLLVKHKLTHKDVKHFRCNVCQAPFNTTKQLMQHIQATGHKYSAERKANLQCIYCLKGFLRDGNLYAHLKTYHKKEAKSDGIIDDSDDEKPEENPRPKIETREGKYHHVKYEPGTSYDNEYEEVDVPYQIQQRHDNEIQFPPRKQHSVITNKTQAKQKILNPGFSAPKPAQKPKPVRKPQPEPSNFLENMNITSPPTSNNHNEEEIVLIDNIEYIMRDNQLIPRKPKPGSNEYIITDMMEHASLQAVQQTSSIEYTNVHNTKILEEGQPMLLKKSSNINQPIQIVVSNEEEYKALMSSNHPILFDNGDANKTLTVLTAPHNAAMESTTIDLDNTQSNNMMIIQEDFPLNVSEAVSTENSNIVVVYSHPVDDPNKQFQILTTEGIGSQFVQSSAILTQNYETVTTSTPAMSANVMEPQTDASWHGNVSSGQQVPPAQEPELQNAKEDGIKSQEVEPSNNLSELPEVHLHSEPVTILEPIQDNLNDTANAISVISSEHINQDIEQEVVEESQNIPTTPMDTDMLREGIVEAATDTVAEPMQVSHEHEDKPTEVLTNNVIQDTGIQQPIVNILEEPIETDLPPIEAVIERQMALIHEGTTKTDDQQQIETAHQQPLDTIHQQTVQSVHQQLIDTVHQQTVHTVHQQLLDTLHDQPIEASQPIIEEKTAEVSETLPQMEEQVLVSSTVTENTEITEDEHAKAFEEQLPLPESQAYDDIVEINTAKVDTQPYTEKAVEKIQNLTSEWSEDEYDVEDAPATVEPDAKAGEETIKNTQDKNNHLNTTITSTASMPEIETEESVSSIPEDSVTSSQETQLLPIIQTVATVPNDPQTQQKISSLLNDWEDNDSQEESTSDVPVVEHKEAIAETSATVENVPKIDNIKNLVSDWDDEEEEIREASSNLS